MVGKLEFGMTELKLASDIIMRGNDYSDGWRDCVETFYKFIQYLMEE